MYQFKYIRVINYTMNGNTTISEIMQIDNKIDFVGIYHNHDSVLEDEFGEDFSIYFDEGKTISDSNQILLTKRDQFPIHYAMTKHGNFIKYLFAVNNHTILLVSSSHNANSDLIISRILDYLR